MIIAKSRAHVVSFMNYSMLIRDISSIDEPPMKWRGESVAIQYNHFEKIENYRFLRVPIIFEPLLYL